MSEIVMLGFAGVFGTALALFIGTSAAAAPVLAYRRVRRRR